MKSATGGLATFLLTAKSMVYADLYTITLNGGTIIRWTTHDFAVAYSGNTFQRGPAIMDNGVKSKRGVQVDTLDVTVYADAATQVSGTPFLTFVRRGGLDGATIKVERAMGSDFASGIGGGYIRFAGRISEIKSLSKTEVTLGCSSWLELLNVDMPTNIISAGCINTLYGAACGLNKATFAATGTASAGGTASTFGSSLTAQATGYFDLGYVLFTSGANAGLQRTVKTHVTGGSFTLTTALVAAPAAGDAFTAYPGCTHTQAICLSKFSNLANFRGMPFVPPPETAL